MLMYIYINTLTYRAVQHGSTITLLGRSEYC